MSQNDNKEKAARVHVFSPLMTRKISKTTVLTCTDYLGKKYKLNLTRYSSGEQQAAYEQGKADALKDKTSVNNTESNQQTSSLPPQGEGEDSAASLSSQAEIDASVLKQVTEEQKKRMKEHIQKVFGAQQNNQSDIHCQYHEQAFNTMKQVLDGFKLSYNENVKIGDFTYAIKVATPYFTLVIDIFSALEFKCRDVLTGKESFESAYAHVKGPNKAKKTYSYYKSKVDNVANKGYIYLFFWDWELYNLRNYLSSFLVMLLSSHGDDKYTKEANSVVKEIHPQVACNWLAQHDIVSTRLQHLGRDFVEDRHVYYYALENIFGHIICVATVHEEVVLCATSSKSKSRFVIRNIVCDLPFIVAIQDKMDLLLTRILDSLITKKKKEQPDVTDIKLFIAVDNTKKSYYGQLFYRCSAKLSFVPPAFDFSPLDTEPSLFAEVANFEDNRLTHILTVSRGQYTHYVGSSTDTTTHVPVVDSNLLYMQGNGYFHGFDCGTTFFRYNPGPLFYPTSE